MREDQLTSMGRRRFISTIASIGVTGTALANISKEALAEAEVDLDNEVPVLVGWARERPDEPEDGGSPPERSPIYEGVPRERWTQVESVRDAADRLREEIGGYGVRVGVGSTTRGHRRELAVDVRYTVEEYPNGEGHRPDVSYSDLRDRLPASMSGTAGRMTAQSREVEDIPVELSREEPELDLSYDCNYRPVPPGCTFRTEYGNPCTIGAPVYDNRAGEKALITASHCFTDPRLPGEADQVRQNNGRSDRIGTKDDDRVEFDHPPNLFDAAVINLNNTDISYRVADDSCDEYSGRSFTGTVSEQHLYYMMDNSYSLTKQGARTGLSSGPVTYVDDTSFEVDTSHGSGDSGCPFWDIQYDGTWRKLMAGVLRGGQDDAQVTQMAEIEDRFGVVV